MNIGRHLYDIPLYVMGKAEAQPTSSIFYLIFIVLTMKLALGKGHKFIHVDRLVDQNFAFYGC